MIDSLIRPVIDPPLNFLGKILASKGISANKITFFGFLCGVIAMMHIFLSQYHFAVFWILANRILDGLDGAVARNSRLSDFGGILDILSDFLVYAGIVFAFGVSKKEFAFPALFLLFSFIGPMVSFLAYAIIAAKRGIETQKQGKKSFYYLEGLCEGFETILALLLMCLFPEYFTCICVVFGALCWLTTIGRILNAKTNF